MDLLSLCNAVKVTHMDKNDEFIISDKAIAVNICIAYIFMSSDI